MDMSKFWGVVRHVVGGIGGGLIGFGYATPDDVTNVLGNLDTVMGAVMALGAVVASIWSKIRS